ncbi:MAG: DUF362 domain-containing protein [Candidatus Bathyarchaeia archaeon]
MKTSKVSLAKSDTRYNTVTKALELVKEDVASNLEGRRRIVVKPNLVSSGNQLCATHVDTVRATIEFLRRYTSSPITVAEGSASDTWACYRNYGYHALEREYGVELVDLNEDDSVEMKVYNRDFKEITIHIAKTIVDADYRVSLAIPKTHDCLIVTLSLKNIVVGSAQGDKQRLHQGYPAMNLNMYKVAKQIPPSLAVIDGWIGMEGNGPVSGTPVEWGVAIVSTDFVAADTVATYLMGFNPNEVGYLTYARGRLGVGDLNQIQVVGENPEPLKRKFKPHRGYEEQKNWQIPSEKLAKLLA